MQACRRGGLEVRCGRSNVKVLRYGALELHFRRVDVEAFRCAALEPECRREGIRSQHRGVWPLAGRDTY